MRTVVADLDGLTLLVREHDVVWLQVTVHDPDAVQVLDPLHDLDKHFRGLHLGVALLLDHPLEKLPT